MTEAQIGDSVGGGEATKDGGDASVVVKIITVGVLGDVGIEFAGIGKNAIKRKQDTPSDSASDALMFAEETLFGFGDDAKFDEGVAIGRNVEASGDNFY